MVSRGGIAAIVWSPGLRHVKDYAVRLNASLYNIHYLLPQRVWLAPIKYIPQSIKTWIVLLRQRPSTVYVFISPVVAALCVFLYCWLAKVPFIMDVGAHAIISRKWGWSIPLVRFLSRKARVNIVDQEDFRRLFDSWGARTILLERPPFGGGKKYVDSISGSSQEKFTVTLISTFSPDEPIASVLEAAQQLADVDIFILGDTGRANRKLLEGAPRNVTFTGYLAGDDYWERLACSHALMALTTAPNSLLSGAVEGMSLGKPLILSNQPALRAYFEKGAVFVDHSPESIAEGVKTVRARRNDLAQQIVELAVVKKERWVTEFEKIWQLLENQN
jgi:glycosyltransferase involved in cell wall biosynthesis